MPKKGENIYKRKDGRWEGRYIRFRNVGGKPEYGYIYGKSYAEVKQKLMTATSKIVTIVFFTGVFSLPKKDHRRSLSCL